MKTPITTIDELVLRRGVRARFSLLTAAQRRVVDAIGGECFTPKSIAVRLGDISHETAKSHLRAIYSTTGIFGMIQLGTAMYWEALSKDPNPMPQPELYLFEILTARELEIARLIADGYSNLNLATILGISEETVKRHINAILKTLGYSHRIEVAFRILRELSFFLKQYNSPPAQ